MKKIVLILVLLSTLHTFSQNSRKFIFGKIYDKVGVLSNVHIINTSTRRATYSNDEGEFKIPAKPNDSLRFSFVGYETKLVLISKKHFSISDNIFYLEKTTYTLDEVQLKKHNLSGSLSSDLRQTPKDRKEEALKQTMDFSNVDMTVVEDDDYIDEKVRPHVVNTDPTRLFVGAGTAKNIPFGYSKRLWALRKELAFKKGMPTKLMAELGEKFFFEDLKIPPERYYHFLEYCNPLGIENLYKKGKKLEIIKILQQESKSYLKIIKNIHE
ncbi:carboxypeptidase-like regulatory domain-containing protein [Tenacibaculum sp. TC6]|uniref:carboxypeptidase-like regulatory domain-containing protein n=1 Tax=Tenacibaculum sp. TC6 TaxID=3423223 RepID=UPI003D35C624